MVMTDTLFDFLEAAKAEPEPTTRRRRCRMCARPAREGSDYCGGKDCNNATRICRHCGAYFKYKIGDADTQYCSPDCNPQVAETSEAPQCRLCHRSAHKSKRTGEYMAYCSFQGCTNRTRICRSCSRDFERRVNGAGDVYCSPRCKEQGYHPTRSASEECAWGCGRMGRCRGSIWPYVCQDCIEPIRHVVDRLKKHRVPHDMARRLTHDPACEVCGTDLLTLVRDQGDGFRTGKPHPRLVVDHDHACCPGSTSCGRCVRGFLCPKCNSAEGMIDGDPELARRLADYLGGAWHDA